MEQSELGYSVHYSSFKEISDNYLSKMIDNLKTILHETFCSVFHFNLLKHFENCYYLILVWIIIINQKIFKTFCIMYILLPLV